MSSLKEAQQGFAHFVAIIVAAIVIVAGVGTFMVVKSHAATCTSYSYKGGSGHCVQDIQALVNWFNQRAGRGTVAVDGSFGPKTKAAVEAVQRQYHLTADGVVGSKTWNVICHPQSTSRSVTATFPYNFASNAGCVNNQPNPPHVS